MTMTFRADVQRTLTHEEADANWRACLGAHNLLHVQDQKAAGTNGGTFESGAWRTRDLNTVIINNIAGASLINNQVLLPSGIYYFDGISVVRGVLYNQIRIYDVAMSTVVIKGVSSGVYTASPAVDFLNRACGYYSASDQAVIELQCSCSNTKTTEGFGKATGLGTEVYSDLKIWRLS